MDGWIFGGAVAAIVIGLLALDWFMAGRSGRGVRGRRHRIKSPGVDYNVLQADLRRADDRGRTETLSLRGRSREAHESQAARDYAKRTLMPQSVRTLMPMSDHPLIARGAASMTSGREHPYG